MNACIYQLIGKVFNYYIKKVDITDPNNDNAAFILKNNIPYFNQYQINLNQFQIQSLKINLVKKEIMIDRICINNISSTQIDNFANQPKKKNIFQILNLFAIIMNFVFGFFINWLKEKFLILIKKLLSNVTIKINSLIIQPEINADLNENINLNFNARHVVIKFINFFDLKYKLSIENFDFDFNDKSFQFYDFCINGEKTINFSIGSFLIQNNLNQFCKKPIQIKNILFLYEYKNSSYKIKIDIPSIFIAIDFEIISMLIHIFALLQKTKDLKENSNNYKVCKEKKFDFILNINDAKFISQYHDNNKNDKYQTISLNFSSMKIKKSSSHTNFMLDSAQFLINDDEIFVFFNVNINSIESEIIKAKILFNSFKIILTIYQVMFLYEFYNYSMKEINKIFNILDFNTNQNNSQKRLFNIQISLDIKSIIFLFSNEKFKVLLNNNNLLRTKGKTDDLTVFELHLTPQSLNDKIFTILLNLTESSFNLKCEPLSINIYLTNLLKLINSFYHILNAFPYQSNNEQSKNSLDFDICIPIFNIIVLYEYDKKSYFHLYINNFLYHVENSLHFSKFCFDKLKIDDENNKYSFININKFKFSLINDFVDIFYDSFNFIYSNQLVSSISVIFKLIQDFNAQIKNKNESIESTEQKNKKINCEFNDTSFSFYDKEKIKVELFTDYIHAYYYEVDSIFNIEINEINIFDNHKKPGLCIFNFIYNSFSNLVLIDVSDIDSKIQFHYLIDLIIYFHKLILNINNALNCFTSFEEKSDFAKNMIIKDLYEEEEEVTNIIDDEQIRIDFCINNFTSLIRINENEILFAFTANGIFTQKVNTVNLQIISLFIDNNMIIEPFSIHYNDKNCIIDQFSLYIPLFKFDIIDNLIKEIKLLQNNIFFEKNKPTDNNTICNSCIITTSKINIFLIKSNLPLILLEILPIKFKYPFVNDYLFPQTEVKLILKYYNNEVYNIINLFSIILRNDQSTINVIVSPIYATLSASLFEELFSPEYKDFQLKFNYNDKIIFFQNDLDEQIMLTLIKKDSNEKYLIDLNNNFPFLLKENEYKSDVLIDYNDQKIQFSVENLYLPIYLNKFIIASIKIKNGFRTIHFSSPYLIKNNLLYDIEVHIDDKNIGIIEKGKEKFIPCSVNFSFDSSIKVARFEDNTIFQTISFKSKKYKSQLIKLYDRKRNRNCYSKVYLKYDSQNSIISIVFVPYMKITNYLPIDLNLIIPNVCNLELNPNQSLDISFLNDLKIDIYFVLNFPGFALVYYPIHFHKNKEFKKIIDLYRQEKQIGNIVVNCSIEKNKICDITIYAHLIIENRTKIPLAIQNSKSISYDFYDDFVFYSSEAISNYECLIDLPLFSPNFTENNTIKFKYVDDLTQLIKLNHIKNNDVSFLISLTKREGICKNSSVIKINPYIKIINEINKTVNFIVYYRNKEDELKKYENICDCYESYITGSNINGLFDIEINGYKACHNVNLFNLSTKIIRFVDLIDFSSYLLIKLIVKKEENGYCCYLLNPSFPSPICVTNFISNKPIYVYEHYQNNSGFSPMIINSYSTTIFAKEQIYLEDELDDKYDINVSFNGEKQYPLSFEKDFISKRIYDTKYLYDVKTINKTNKLIIIYDLSDPYKDNENDQIFPQDDKKEYYIHFTEIQISYIDKYIHELFLLTMKNVKLIINESIKFNINSLSLNDMYSGSCSPVVLFGERNPFLDVDIKTKYNFSDFIFDNISINLSPLQIFCDFQFISDLIASIKELKNHCLIQSQNKPNSGKLKLFSTKKFSIDTIILTISPINLPQRKFRFQHPDYYNISQMAFVKFSNCIPFDINYQVNFDNLTNMNVESPISEFLQSIFSYYINQIGIQNCIKKIFRGQLHINTKNKFEIQNFDGLIKNSVQSNDILQYPIRIPRSFPKRKILNIDSKLIKPDIFSLTQFKFQKHSKEDFINEQLHELYEDSQNKILSIFDNYIFIYDPNNDEISIEINFYDIKRPTIDEKSISINYDNTHFDFTCKSEQEKLHLIQKINSIIEKTKILKNLKKIQ